MKDKLNILGIIPARGGSKGIKLKNIKLLGKEPLIAYTIKSALGSKYLTEIIVSTDSIEIQKISQNFGVKAPFIRPEELSTDLVPTLPVLQHAINFCESNYDIRYDIIVLLQPTCPFRTSEDIDKCIEILIEKDYDSVVSVVDVEGHHPLRMKRLYEDRLINYIDQGSEDMRPRQILPKVFIRNGAIYATKIKIIKNQNLLVSEDCGGYIMPQNRSINIDNHVDFAIAEYHLKSIIS